MSEDAYFRTVLECKDDLDRKINFSTVGMIMGLGIDSMLPDKRQFDAYFHNVADAASSLLKMNDHFRKYITEEERFLEEYRVKFINDPDVNSHSSTPAVSLMTELDGFLSHFKGGLDSLAKTFNLLFGFAFDAWHKKDGQSGLPIINSIERNLNNQLKDKSKNLIRYMRENTEWLTSIVSLRDDIHHKGGLKNVSDVLYNFRTKEVIPQIITLQSGHQMLVRSFISMTMDDAVEYFNAVLCFCLEIRAFGGMLIRENPKKEFPYYQWAIKISDDKPVSDIM